jgi:hypothetical protein
MYRLRPAFVELIGGEMKANEFLSQSGSRPQLPQAPVEQPAEQEQSPSQKSFWSEAYDWGLAVGGFLLLNNYFFGQKKDKP